MDKYTQNMQEALEQVRLDEGRWASKGRQFGHNAGANRGVTDIDDEEINPKKPHKPWAPMDLEKVMKDHVPYVKPKEKVAEGAEHEDSVSLSHVDAKYRAQKFPAKVRPVKGKSYGNQYDTDEEGNESPATARSSTIADTSKAGGGRFEDGHKHMPSWMSPKPITPDRRKAYDAEKRLTKAGQLKVTKHVVEESDPKPPRGFKRVSEDAKFNTVQEGRSFRCEVILNEEVIFEAYGVTAAGAQSFAERYCPEVKEVDISASLEIAKEIARNKTV